MAQRAWEIFLGYELYSRNSSGGYFPVHDVDSAYPSHVLTSGAGSEFLSDGAWRELVALTREGRFVKTSRLMQPIFYGFTLRLLYMILTESSDAQRIQLRHSEAPRAHGEGAGDVWGKLASLDIRSAVRSHRGHIFMMP